MHVRHGQGLHDALGFERVVTQKVHRFTHLGHSIAPGFERLFDQEGAGRGCLRLELVGSGLENA